LIFQIFRDKKGNLWVGTQNNGVFRHSENFFKRYGSSDGLTGNSSHAAIEDSEGRLLFGTENGLVQFNGERFTPVKLPPQYRGSCEVLFEDAQKTLWIGGTNCVVSLKWKNGQPLTKFYQIPVGEEVNIYGFCEDAAHRLYVGTFRGGLFRLSGDSLENLSETLKLNEETFFTLRYINGLVFGASLNGVLVLNTQTGKLSRITDEDGLNSELVYSIEFSLDKKWLWIGTNQGINKLDLEKYLTTHEAEIIAFGRQEGFMGVECNSNCIWEDKDGTLCFGTVSGLIKHQPFNFKRNLVENKTLIQNIKLLNEDTLLPDSAILPSDYNVISFYYRGICLTNPEKVLYQR
jgi:ligand-binding sensor domain-containing protein